jgi:hypothetical protein
VGHASIQIWVSPTRMRTASTPKLSLGLAAARRRQDRWLERFVGRHSFVATRSHSGSHSLFCRHSQVMVCR